jgi:hypothetical protein
MTTIASPEFFRNPVTAFNRKLEGVAESYEDQGYDILFAPSEAQLPDFLVGFYPDAIATRANDHVVIEIKSDSKVRPEDYWLNLAKAIQTHRNTGWALRLLVDHQPAESWESISLEDIESQVHEAYKQTREGATNGALLLAWAALEAAMRWTVDINRIEVSDYSAPRLISSLYADGVLERDEYDLLAKYVRVRHSAAHGFRSRANPQEVEQLCELVLRLARLPGKDARVKDGPERE